MKLEKNKKMFFDKLKEARIKQGLYCTEISRALGLDRKTIGSIEAKQTGNIDILFRIADYLGYDIKLKKRK